MTLDGMLLRWLVAIWLVVGVLAIPALLKYLKQ